MFQKNYFTFLIAIALFLTGSATVFAQSSPIRGQVLLKKADGTKEPVAGALIDIYRIDVNAKLPSGKSDKKGYFTFAGIPVGHRFVLAVSAPNIKPEIAPDIKSGMDNIIINVLPGDGRVLTEKEVRDALASGSGTAQNAQPTEEQKKALAEYEKQVAEVGEKNKKIQNANEIINKAVEEGRKAFETKNYDLAIAKFSEGVEADPEFAGTAPVLLNNKALAEVTRATDNYNLALKGDPAARITSLETVKKDYQNAVADSERAIAILKTADATDPAVKKSYDAVRLVALTNRKEAYRLMIKTGADRTKSKEMALAFQEYLDAETDPAKKSAGQLAFAEALLDAQEFEQAIVEFEKVLTADAANVEALAGAGFSLVNVGYISNDKTKFQQGANYLQKFAEIAPDSHKYKADAKSLLETLKKEQNVAPQKTTKAPARKKS